MRLQNTVFARRRRHFTLIAAGALALAAVAAAFEKSVGSLAFGAAYIVGIYAAVIVAPRLLGVPYAQDYVELSPAGLSYGHRQHVPWSCVRSFRLRRAWGSRIPRADFVTDTPWPAAGLAGRVLARQALPLSALSREWQRDTIEDLLSRYAPHISILDEA